MSRLLAPLLIVHGAIHIGYVCGPAWPFAVSEPWLVTLAGVGADTTRAIGIALALMAFVGYQLTAITATGFASSLWPVLVSASATASAILLVLFATPWTLPGLAIDAALVVATVARGWRPARFLIRRPAAPASPDPAR